MDQRAVTATGLSRSLMMEASGGEELCFPQLLNTSCRKPTISWVIAVFLQFLLFFNSVSTVTLNLFVIISVSHFRQLHKTTNFLLLSLAISDLMVGLVFFPGESVRLTTCWLFGDIMCLMYIYIISLIVSASVGNIVLISVDRYVAICDPLHYHSRITVTRTQLCICLCWLYSAFYSITFVGDGISEKKILCHGQCVLFNYYAFVIDLVLSFTVPVTVIIVLYSKVFVMAVFQARAIRSRVTAISLQRTVTGRKSELKAARTLGILVLVFLMCFCPFYFAALGGDISFNTSATVLCLFSINSCLNPLIYAIFYPWFRKAIKHIVTLNILQSGSSKANIL
ncbi:trace amine-associated receptor 13c-like [Girardinichthys multiradiatus]|uniref:trace amine-associated receptor 13c-like n=1 Tax=Girardinichthys multiradiatus TaxID=208333 RepID=UPI001FAE3DCE|nr:trace amine-associated receptor 13c-like [Girardinichthys multiradiatus]